MPCSKLERDLLAMLEIMVANAELIPDPRMNGSTDVYAVPLDDVEEARRLLEKARNATTHSPTP